MTQLHVSEITAKQGNLYAQIGNEIVLNLSNYHTHCF